MISNRPVMCGQEDVVVSGTVRVAGAHLDEHHLALEEVPIWLFTRGKDLVFIFFWV